MHWELRLESLVLVPTTILCLIIVWNLMEKLRKVLPFCVNCWFCDTNAWVLFPERNSWTCNSCDQYNGFTKDGDYNRPLPLSPVPTLKSLGSFSSPPPSNGLCYMCNINQQLKVAQLANFVPINEHNFDKEIAKYKSQLEKAYRLCAHCRKVLKTKLHEEKEALLGSKLLQSRSPKKNNKTNRKIINNLIRYFFIAVTISLVSLVSLDCYNYLNKFKYFKNNIYLARQIIFDFFESLTSIIKAKIFVTFPILQEYEEISLQLFYEYYDQVLTHAMRLRSSVSVNFLTNSYMQQLLGGVGCLTQIMCHLLRKSIVKHQTMTDLLWTVLLLSLINRFLSTTVLLAIKILTATALFITYKSVNLNKKPSIFASPKVSSRRMKNLISSKSESSASKLGCDSDSDSDASLSQYGFDSTTTFSGTRSPLSCSSISRNTNTSFAKKTASLWSVPSANSSFNCSSPILNTLKPQKNQKSPTSGSKKAEFQKYQYKGHYDSDSDLDEGINGLNLGTSPEKVNPNNIFAVKNFQPSFNFAALDKEQRQLICPSKLGQSTSWVAGGTGGTTSAGARSTPPPADPPARVLGSSLRRRAFKGFSRRPHRELNPFAASWTERRSFPILLSDSELVRPRFSTSADFVRRCTRR